MDTMISSTTKIKARPALKGAEKSRRKGAPKLPGPGRAPLTALLLFLATAALVGCTPAASWGKDPAQAAGGGGVGDGQSRAKGSQVYYYFIKSNYEEIKANEKRVPPLAALTHMISAASLDPGSVYLNMETARLLARNSRPEAALKYAQKAIDLAPQNPAPRKLAAYICNLTEKWEEAIRHYQAVLAIAPEDTEALIYLATIYQNQGLKMENDKRPQEAREYFSKAEKLYQDRAKSSPDHKSFYLLGRYYIESDQPQEAVKALVNAAKLKPDDVETLVTLAAQYESLKDLKKAEQRYREAVKAAPDLPLPRIRLADILTQSGRKKEADKILSEIDLKEQSGQDQFGLGLLYRDQGLYDKAVDAFQSVINRDPDNDRARFLMAVSYLGLDQLDRAREELGKITKDKDTFIDARLIMAQLVENPDLKKRLEEALVILNEASRARPDDPRLIITRSQYMIELNDLAGARKVILAAARKMPRESDIYFQLGVIEDKLGNKQGTIKAMRKAIELNGDHADALNYLAYTWAERKENLKEALTLAEKADRLKPNSGYIIDTLAWIHFQLGDAEKALMLLEAAVPISGGDPVVLDHLGDVLMALGRTNEALTNYRQALETEHISTQEKLQEELNDKIRRLSK